MEKTSVKHHVEVKMYTVIQEISKFRLAAFKASLLLRIYAVQSYSNWEEIFNSWHYESSESVYLKFQPLQLTAIFRLYLNSLITIHSHLQISVTLAQNGDCVLSQKLDTDA